jgi:hypothetical protein
MKMNRNGCTRYVFILRNVVVKIPKPSYNWQNFLKGIIANIHESETWRFNSGKYEKGNSHLLCPVLWCSWGGWVLVMRKVDELITEENINKFDCTEHIKHFEGDDTISNYGILKGKLVKIDYGQ